MNTIQNKSVCPTLVGRLLVSVRLKLAMLALAGLSGYAAQADPDGTYAAPYPMTGTWGSYTADNTTAVAEVGMPNIAGFAPNAPVWFQFTAPYDGEVTIDTMGSLDFSGFQMDTLLAVYAGGSLPSLYQVAANDDAYPFQYNAYSQSAFSWIQDTPEGPLANNVYDNFAMPPFTGPSVLRLNVKAGNTYYVLADISPFAETGTIALNWAYHSSGVFRFASEVKDIVGLVDAGGNPYLLAPAAEGSMAYVTVTRVAGSSGRCSLTYSVTSMPEDLVGADGFLANGDLPAVAGTGFYPASGVLVFDDFEMSKTISVYVPLVSPTDYANRDFLVVLSDPQLDLDENPDDVSAPRVDPVYGQIVVRSLNKQVFPNTQFQINTNPPPYVFVYTNWSGDNSAFNFSSTRYFVTRKQAANAGYDRLIAINRGGTPGSVTNAATFYYVVTPNVPQNPGFVENAGVNFPLSPGSEYAVPDPATDGSIFTTAAPDFTVPGGYTGTITFAAKDARSKFIPITIYPTTNANFNKDFQIQLYAVDTTPQDNKIRIGMVDSTVVTILFDDQHPPAGSVDQLFNADYNLNYSFIIYSDPPDMAHPGTDGQVYGVAVQNDNKSIVAGEFYTYNGFSRNCIARVNTDGSLDTTFDPGDGVGAVPGFNDPPIFINVVVADASANKVLIAGSFSSYDGSARGNVARLNNNGTLDASFDPGSGADGPVYALYLQGDGKIMIGGDFSSYNGYPVKNLARLNADGSLDQTFNPGTALNAPVYALTEEGGTFIDASRSASGTELEDVNTVNVGAPTGVLTVDYNFYAADDEMRVYYGGTNGVLIFNTGLTNNIDNGFMPITVVIPFGPTNGLTANTITIVMNQGNGVPGTIWDYTATVQSSEASQLYVGGDFTDVGGNPSQDHITRFLGDGSVDTSFNPNARINGPVYALAAQSGGLVLAGGEFSQANNLDYNRLVRFQRSGILDTNFMVGTGVNGTVFNLNARPDGTFYVGGAFTAVNGTHRLGFARMLNDGTVDTSFLDTAYNQFAGLPRVRFSDPLGAVYSSAVQPNGGVMIGGSFDQVGGGQYEASVRPDSNLYATQFRQDRAGIRNRSNFARLIGGETPGPGNVGLLTETYSVNKGGSALYVSLLRTNGNLGHGTANFSVIPGLAQSGTDFAYSSLPPTYGIHWEYFGQPNELAFNPYTRMHSDGFWGTNTFLTDITTESSGRYYQDLQSQQTVTVINTTTTSGDVNAQFQLANPVNADQFYLGGQNIPLGVALGRSSAPLTIVDDQHQSGVVGFADGAYIGNVGNAPVAVVRTNGNYGKISVQYKTVTNGSTAILGTDYTARSGTLSLLNGISSNNFTVPVLNANYISSVEKIVNLQLSTLQAPPNGIATWGVTNAVLRIINANYQGYLNFSVSNYMVNLSSNVAYITVTRTVGSKGTLTAQMVTTNGTALSGTDYVGVTNSLQWNNGDVSSRVVAIPLTNAGTLGGTREFYVKLVNPALNGTNAPSLLGLIPSATVTISNDNHYGTFQFSAADYTVNENGGTATLTITRTGSTLGAVSVDFATANGTAVSPANYTATSQTLNFTNGQTAAYVTVPIVDDGINDNLDPSQFYFQAELSGPGVGGSLGAPVLASVHIVDAQQYNRPPGSGDVTFNANPGFDGPVFALAQQANGQLIAGGNFAYVNGSARNNLARLNVDGTTDVAGFLNGLSGANDAVYALVNQTDDRILLGGQFTSVNGVVRKRIARVMLDGSLDTSFNPGTGADGTAYALATTFISGNRKVYVGGAFSTFNNVSRPFLARLNNNGSVDAAFNPGFGPNGNVYAVATYPTNSLNAGKVIIGGQFTTVNNFPVSYLARLNADGSVDTNFSGTVGLSGIVREVVIQSDDSILVGGDFSTASDSVNGVVVSAHLARIKEVSGQGRVDVSFASDMGLGPNARVNDIALQADNRIVVAGEFSQANGVARNGITRLLPSGAVDPTINFGSGANGVVYAALVQSSDQMLVLGGAFTQYNGQPHLHIARAYGGSQTDQGAFEFSSAAYSVAENEYHAAITIRRTGGTSGTNSVFLATANLTAVAGVNYSSVIQTVVFPPGEVLQTVSVPVFDDGVITPDLTVDLTLANSGPQAGLGDQTNAVLTIQNVESVVAFSSPNYAVPAATLTGRANINVLRLGTTNVVSSVDFLTTTNGTAVAGVDFHPTNLTVTFNVGEASKVVQIGIITAAPLQGDRTVVFSLSNALNTAIYHPSNTTLTILGTNGPGTLSFLTNSVVVSEDNAQAVITVIRTGGAAGIVTANYATTPGTAVPGVNYQTTSGNVSFGEGETNRTILVPLVNNSLVQGAVMFNVTLSAATGGASLPLNPATVVSILDNDAGIAFASATNNAPENGSYANVSVLRLYNTNSPASVQYQTVDGTALAGVNYTAVSGGLNFAVGETIKSLSIPIFDNTNATGDLTFSIRLSSPVGAQLIAPSNTVVVVQDADAGITFTNDTMRVLKNAGYAVVTVICANPRVQPEILTTNDIPLQVDYFTADGTAKAGVDYWPASGTLVFTNGLATNTFTVPIFNNFVVTGDRTFDVVLTNVTAPGQLMPYGTQTVVIVESNPGFRFSASTYKAAENTINTVIQVQRTGYTNSAASVDFMTANGTAKSGENFINTSGTLLFTNGVISQSFNVPLIDNSQIQPNLTVQLQLLNPTNGVLVSPSVATLTIVENDGSYVVPSGSQLVTNYTTHVANGIINSNNTVQVLFALRAESGLDVTNLIAYLQTTNGVTSPSPASQNYGALQVGGHAAFRPFTFTAIGTNGQPLIPTFTLKDGDKFIGTAEFPFGIGTTTAVFSNTTPIVIRDRTNALPYPSIISVSGVGSTLVKATVTLTNLYHAWPADIAALVVSPAQTNALLMGNAGAGFSINKVTLTFDDAATNSLPKSTIITNGVYRPTIYEYIQDFP